MDRIRQVPESKIKTLHSSYFMTQLEYMNLSSDDKNRILRDYFILELAKEIVNKLLKFEKIRIMSTAAGVLFSISIDVIVPETPKNEDH